MAKEKPNILFINTDQHTWNALSAYGCKWVKTPNIDRLHENGVSFMRSYSPDPVCGPARSSWWTGRYTSETGSVFGAPAHDSIPDLGQILNANGYRAYHCGKWHFDGRDVAGSFHNLYVGKRPIGASAGEFYDTATTHAAISLLNSYNEDEPFFLGIGYVNPHDICEYLHNHEQKIIPTPLEQGNVDENQLPPLPENFDYDEVETGLMRAIRREPDSDIHSPTNNAVKKWPEVQWRYYIWNYYRFVEKVDAEIGLVLAVLENSRFKDNTLILFVSDHGEALGSHRMFQKFTLYEESVRVPFIAACLGDGVEVRKNVFDVNHLTSGIDLLPTVCDYAGIPTEENHGLSLRPLISGEGPKGWRDYIYAESNYWGRMIVTADYKYVTEYLPKEEEDFFPPGPDPNLLGVAQLFDLKADPGETRNLAYLEKYQDVVAGLKERLLAHEEGLFRRPLQDENMKRKIIELSKYIKGKNYPRTYPII